MESKDLILRPAWDFGAMADPASLHLWQNWGVRVTSVPVPSGSQPRLCISWCISRHEVVPELLRLVSASAPASSRGRPVLLSFLLQDVQGRLGGRKSRAGRLCEHQALWASIWAEPSGWRRTDNGNPIPSHSLHSLCSAALALLSPATPTPPALACCPSD